MKQPDNKKICVLTSVHSALDVRIFAKEALTLSKNGYDVSIIGQNNNDEIRDGIKIIALPKPKTRLNRFFSTLKILRLAVRENAKIYHFHDFELIPAALALKVFGKKVIYDIHEDNSDTILFKYWLKKFLRRPVSFLIRLIEMASCNFFDIMIVAPPGIKERFPHKKTILVINYPTQDDIDKIKHVHNKAAAGPFKFIYQGAIMPVKGIENIIAAVNLLKHDKRIELDLYGKIEPSAYVDELRKKYNFDRISYLGFLNRDKLLRILEEYDAGLVIFDAISNYMNTLPIKLFEYMAAGLPVIVSDFPIWREIIDEAKCGICVKPNDPAMAADAMRHMAAHPQECMQMGINGRKAVEEKYNWKKEGEKLLKVYDELTRQ